MKHHTSLSLAGREKAQVQEQRWHAICIELMGRTRPILLHRHFCLIDC